MTDSPFKLKVPRTSVPAADGATPSGQMDIADDGPRPYECNHAETRLVRRVLANGTERFPRQCLACGRETVCVRKAEIGERDRAALPTFDEDLPRRWGDEQSAMLRARLGRQRAERDEESRRWWAWYEAYLLSPEWRAKRSMVLARAAGRCEGCGLAPAAQVHHLTYERVGREMLFDLVAVCLRCHEAIHDPENDRRDAP